MSERFHADQLSHGFFQFTKPFTTWGWVAWGISIVFMLLNLPYLMKHQIVDEDAASQPQGPDS